MIGRHWLVTDGARRLDAPADPVRVELRTAIATKVPLIAVLVDHGVLPSASELPADIRGVTTAMTVQLRDDTLDVDMRRLLLTIASLERRSGRPPAPAVIRLINEGSGWFTSGDPTTFTSTARRWACSSPARRRPNSHFRQAIGLWNISLRTVDTP